MKSLRTHRSTIQRQRGVVFIVMMVIMVLGTASLLVSSLNSASLQMARDQATADALAQAKEALIGYAASADLSSPAAASPRPGNLPCPDNNPPGPLEGTPSACGGGFALGRLPWKTLGLPDLRDSSGERLWYAVSSNFKKSPPYTCIASGLPGCLNSDTVGTITVRSAGGNIIYDASLNNGVVAVIIAPGSVLQRTDKIAPQDRSNIGANAPENYLDIALGEDNANFADATTNGFIQGRIKDGNGNVILNDQLLIISQDNVMQAVQKRVAAEVRQCLNEYALPANGGVGRYPWAAKLDPAQPPNYGDTSGRRFGRVPDTPFNNTESDGAGMNDTWAGNCNINSGSGWWLNWKEMVFYGLADAYKPVSPISAPSCGTCLTVNPPSAAADKRFVVIVAGKTLAAQSRSSVADKANPANYLEGANSAGASPFAQGAPSATFNDTVVFP